MRIGFPLLSDAGSTVIKAYGLLNTTVEPGSRADGVPFPGTFVLDGRGRVTARFFEAAYQERNTVASILARQGSALAGGPVVAADTKHLAVQASISDGVVAPGSRVTLSVAVTPRPGMHVYAPGTPHLPGGDVHRGRAAVAAQPPAAVSAVGDLSLRAAR